MPWSQAFRPRPAWGWASGRSGGPGESAGSACGPAAGQGVCRRLGGCRGCRRSRAGPGPPRHGGPGHPRAQGRGASGQGSSGALLRRSAGPGRLLVVAQPLCRACIKNRVMLRREGRAGRDRSRALLSYFHRNRSVYLENNRKGRRGGEARAAGGEKKILFSVAARGVIRRRRLHIPGAAAAAAGMERAA